MAPAWAPTDFHSQDKWIVERPIRAFATRRAASAEVIVSLREQIYH